MRDAELNVAEPMPDLNMAFYTLEKDASVRYGKKELIKYQTGRFS